MAFLFACRSFNKNICRVCVGWLVYIFTIDQTRICDFIHKLDLLLLYVTCNDFFFWGGCVCKNKSDVILVI